MSLLARALATRSIAWVVVIATVLAAVVCALLSGTVKHEDDVLAFLPEGNRDIEAFTEINQRFGGLDVALVGLEVEDAFAPDFLTALQETTRYLKDLHGVDAALSLTSLEDFYEDPMGGVVTAELVDRIPIGAAEKAALRTKVMSRDHVVGTFISEDETAVLILVFATYGTEHTELAAAIRDVVEPAFEGHRIYWGGAPFVNSYIFETTEADMARLTPWAVVAIILIILVSFRDWVGSVLALGTTAMGILVSRAAMAVTGVSFNIVLSSMPVILFAVGSAYSIHMLSRYYAFREREGLEPAVRRMVAETGPVVVAAGLTTVVGLLSFVMMDIRPMRTFGVFTAVGIFSTLVLSVTFVPAVVRLTGLNRRAPDAGVFKGWMVRFSLFFQQRRLATGLGIAALAVLSAVFVGQVDTRVDSSAFFSQGSEPDLSQRFLDEHFGGSQYVQLQISGDLDSPEVVREIRRVADRIRQIPLVSDVQDISGPVSLVNDAMVGMRRVPDTREQLGLLYGFLSANIASKQLVTRERDASLVHIKVGSSRAADLDVVLSEVEAIVSSFAVQGYAVAADEGRLEEQVVWRVLGLSRSFGVPVPDPEAVRSALGVAPPGAEASSVAQGVLRFLASEENWVPLDAAQQRLVADKMVALGPSPDLGELEAMLEATLGPDPGETTVGDLVVVLPAPVESVWAQASAAAHARAVLDQLKLEAPGGEEGQRFVDAVTLALVDLQAPGVLVPQASADQALVWEISGMPLLYRGLSHSVRTNQLKSLGMALVLVMAIMTAYFRSLSAGALATVPTALTLLVVYGGMGARGVHLDIGTSMLASIIIGAGVDYAVHLMAAWRGSTLEGALENGISDTAPAIWTNALMVAAGFFILTLGEAKPLQNVGGLTSTAMLVAAVVTFVAIPVFARRSSYGTSV